MTVGQGAFRGLQDMRTPLAITLAANGINLALDTLLIVVLGWGVKGAATATTTAEWVAALAYLGVLYGRRDALGGLSPRLVLGSSMQAAVAEMTPFLKAGGAMLMRTGLLLGTKTLASATAARWVGFKWQLGAGRAGWVKIRRCQLAGWLGGSFALPAAGSSWGSACYLLAPSGRGCVRGCLPSTQRVACPCPAGWAWCPWRPIKWSRSSGSCLHWSWIRWPSRGRAWWLCRCGGTACGRAWV